MENLDRQRLRTEISELFIKWGMGTRQVVIIELVNIIEREVNMANKDKGKKEKKKKKKQK